MQPHIFEANKSNIFLIFFSQHEGIDILRKQINVISGHSSVNHLLASALCCIDFLEIQFNYQQDSVNAAFKLTRTFYDHSLTDFLDSVLYISIGLNATNQLYCMYIFQTGNPNPCSFDNKIYFPFT